MIKIGKYIAIISLVFGTTILIHFAITLDSEDVEVGFYYIAIAFYTNITVLIILFLMAIWHKNHKEILNSIKWILLNIPIAFIYFFVAIYLNSLSELKFINRRDDVITDVKLKWDDDFEQWDEIDVGEKFFERLTIHTSSPVSIEYVYKNKKITEVLFSPYPSLPSRYEFDIK
jgi:hypothetical protein